MPATPTPAGQLLVGASVRVRFSGQVSSTGAAVVVTLDDGSGATVTLPPALVVDVREDAQPSTQGSVIRASVNGGPVESLTLTPNNNGALKWRRESNGAGFVGGSDGLSGVQALFIAPPVLVPTPKP